MSARVPDFDSRLNVIAPDGAAGPGEGKLKDLCLRKFQPPQVAHMEAPFTKVPPL